jgi:hypothetical protein
LGTNFVEETLGDEGRANRYMCFSRATTMTHATDFFAERYRNKSAWELARLAAEEDNLAPEAREALRAEIARRPQTAEQAPAPAQASAPTEDSLDGVRGWLFLYCLVVIIGCIRSIIVTVVTTINGGVPLLIALLDLGVVGWNVATVVAIFVRARSTLRMVFIQLILSAGATALILGAQIASVLVSNESQKVLILRSVLNGAGILLWYRYFCESKRVRITLGRNL